MDTSTPSPGSVTNWLQQLKAGDPRAAQALFERYFGLLIHKARKKLAALPRRAADEEDVALTAFDAFFKGFQKGSFPQLDDREDLRKLLVTLAERKAVDLIERENAQKRGGGKATVEPDWEQLAAREPSPEEAALFAEEVKRLLDQLDASLRAIALW
jgi:DNA-directed RNA polymerase specialized sigma24 family protein